MWTVVKLSDVSDSVWSVRYEGKEFYILPLLSRKAAESVERMLNKIAERRVT